MAHPDNLWLPALLSALATLHAYLALDVLGRVTRARGAVPVLAHDSDPALGPGRHVLGSVLGVSLMGPSARPASD